MKKRRPLAEDRDFKDYFLKLPMGTHVVEVQSDMRAPDKREGGMVFHHGNRLLVVIPGK